MSKETLKLARQIIWRYRHETPLGNQPHMIAHEADEAIERIDQTLAKQEQGEPESGFFSREAMAAHSDGHVQPQQRKPLTDDEAFALVQQDYRMEEYARAAVELIRRTEAAHGIKE
jgi:hypothetical protein